MSLKRTPLIHDVIPFIDIITNDLVSDFIDNDDVHLIVRHAAYRGYLMLNKYYSLTDDSSVYRIAMSEFYSNLLHFPFHYLITLVLHPKYKTKYFVDAGWERPWIVVAENLARTEWRDNYKKTNPAGQRSTQHTPSEQSGSSTNSVS